MAVGDVTIQTCTFAATLNSELRKEFDGRSARDPLSITNQLVLATGTGAEKANMIWSDYRSVASGIPDDLDLSGVLTSAFKDTVLFTKVRLIMIRNTSTESSLLVGAAASNPLASLFGATTHQIRVPPAGATYPGLLVVTAPTATALAVAAGSADVLRIAHGAEGTTAITYHITIIGEG